MSTTILTVAVLLACALAWRRHHWTCQQDRMRAAFAVLTKVLREGMEDAFRRMGEHVAAATANISAYSAALAHDPHPDLCWRCNASPSADDLGLCEPCKAGLTRGMA